MKLFRFLLMFLITTITLTVGMAVTLHGQTYQGRILGTIRDSSGAVVVGAKITITNTATQVSRQLVTNQAGEYAAPNLEPGVYVVSAESTGFEKSESTPIRLEVAKDLQIDLVLQPGTITQTVEVKEAEPLIDTTNATLGGAFGNKEINDLPLQGRDFQNLVMLRPGIDRTPGGGFHSITSNGNRPEDNNYIVDGTDDNDAYYGETVVNDEGVSGTPATHLPIDAIQEFTAEEHPSAEYGFKPGGIINIGLKSGTNDLHGTAYYFHRNSAFDARNFFNPVGEPISALRLHQFGASLGGPVMKDKWFFFADYEGVRDAVGNPEDVESPATVPLPTFDPTTSIPDAITQCHSTPGCTVNPLSLKLATLFPTNNGTNPAGTGEIYQDLDNSNNENNGIIKTDFVVSTHNTITGRYFYGGGTQNEEDEYYLLPQWLSQATTTAQLIGVGWTWTPNSTWVNEARFGYSRFWQVIASADQNVPSTAYGINSGVTNPADFGMPVISVGGFTQLGGNSGWPLTTAPTQTWQWSDNDSYLKGKHTIRFGGDFRHGSVVNRRDDDGKGSVDFETLADFIDAGSVDSTGVLGCSNTTCGPDEGNIFVGDSLRHVSMNSFGLYVQDDWRFNPHLTINAGLRYDMSTVIKDSQDLLGNFDPTLGFVQVGKQISSPYNGDHNNLAPRLGIAWDPFGDSKMVVRAGGGIIYEAPHISAFIGQSGGGEGLNAIPTGAAGVKPGGGSIDATDVTLPGTALNWTSSSAKVFPVVNTPLNCSAIDPDSGDPIPCSITGVDRNLRTPYSIFWNLGVQRAIGRSSALDVAYVGNHGVKLYSLLDINQPNPAISTPCYLNGVADSAACEQFARPFYSKFPFVGIATILGNADDSIYHGLQTTYTIRNLKGLNIVAGYTYSHAIDEASNNRSFLAQNSHDLAAERATSGFDVRNRFTLALNYALPSPHYLHPLLGGWQVNSVAILESGLPVDFHDYDDDISLTGEFNDRWNIFGNYNDVHWTASPAPDPSQPCNPAVRLCYFYYESSSLPANTQFAAANPACVAHTSIDQLNNFGCYQEGKTVIVPPEFGTFGNMSRNAFRGPDFLNWDFSLMKSTKLTERLTLQLRGEFFNILNHPNFAGVNGELFDGASVGQVINTADVFASNPVMGSGGSRHIQIGAKFIF